MSSDDCLTRRKSDFGSAVHCPDFVDDVLPKQSPNSNELLPRSVTGNSVKPKQHSHCLQNNITFIDALGRRDFCESRGVILSKLVRRQISVSLFTLLIRLCFFFL